MGKTNKKEELNIPVMVLCIVGTVLVVFGFMLLRNDNFKLNVISTEGTVTGTQIKQAADGNIESRSVNLSYRANNSDYNATINNYPDNVNIGDKITLYYDLISPESVSDTRRGYIDYIAVILGIILVVKTGPKFIRIIKDNYLCKEDSGEDFVFISYKSDDYKEVLDDIIYNTCKNYGLKVYFPEMYQKSGDKRDRDPNLDSV